MAEEGGNSEAELATAQPTVTMDTTDTTDTRQDKTGPKDMGDPGPGCDGNQEKSAEGMECEGGERSTMEAEKKDKEDGDEKEKECLKKNGTTKDKEGSKEDGEKKDKEGSSKEDGDKKGKEDSKEDEGLTEDKRKEADRSEADGSAVSEAAGTSKETDPYSYVNRDEFTSEIYKIEVFNLPKYFGITELKKRLINMELKPSKVKVVKNGNYAFVNFRCEEDRQKALDVIPGHKWKGKEMGVKKAKPAADPLVRKRKVEAVSGTDQPKSKSVKNEEEDSDVPIGERLNKVVTPWWKMSYDEQLQAKQKEMTEFIKKLGRDIEKNNFFIREWMTAQRKANAGLCCTLHTIKPSPCLTGYRNKCEFTVGQNQHNIDNTVGFRLGRYRGGVVTVVEPTDCINIPDSMKTVAKTVQEYLQQQSSRPGFDPETKEGHWRQVTVRTNRRGGVLVILHFHPQKLSDEELQAEKQSLKEYFQTEGDGLRAGVTSLFFQSQSERLSEELPCEHLLGEKYIHETLLELNFRISPTAFFQVNTEAAEVLYSTVADWCKIKPTTTLLDVCCGTGTIGLTMAKRVAKVVGLELCKEAVEDAEVNRELNDVTNAVVHCGKAEVVLPSILPAILRESGDDIVAVVDPPRAGLHADVVRTIRKHHEIKRLIYVSCNPPGALANIVDLTRSESRRMKGPAFRILEAVPVDMFPQTPHCELVMLLER